MAALYGLPPASAEADTNRGEAVWEDAARDWAIREILLQEANKRHLEQDSLFQSQLNRLHDELLINLLYQMAAAGWDADSSEVEGEYSRLRQEFVTPADQVDLTYIVAPTRELANQARRVLQEDGSMEQALGLDGSMSGEAVGWVGQKDLDEAIAKPLFSLLPGGISYPLKLDEGRYIVLQCRQRRSQGTLLPLDEVYEEIRMRALQRKKAQAEKELRDSLWAVYKPEIYVRGK